MLENIHIQNFRCFEDFKAEGFERINLIGGKNNSGKSCLLEGILCLNKIAFITSIDVASIREQQFRDLLNEKIDFGEAIISADKYKCVLNFSESGYGQNHTNSLNSLYIKSNIVCPNYSAYSGFEKLEKKFQEDAFLEVFNLVSSKINKIRTISNTGYHPQIKETHNTNFIHLKGQGDAVKLLFNYFMPLILRKNKIEPKKESLILLIDEIENGLHYSAHYDFWKKLFQLSKSENVQVFSTTHSLEMIQAFNQVAKEEGEGAYFEMMRDEKSNQITALKHSPNVLDEELELNMKFRGEEFKTNIELSQDMIDTLQNSLNNAKENAKKKLLSLPFIRDGKLFQLNTDGTEELIKELEIK